MQNRALIVATSPSSAIEVGRLLLEAEKFESVSLLTSGTRDIRLSSRLQRLEHQGLKLIDAEPTSIDFGLTGTAFLQLRSQVTHLIVCGSPGLKLEQLFIGKGSSSDLESSRPLRLAAEVKEFMSASGPALNVVLESSLMVFGSSEVAVTETDLQVGQDFPSALHESLAIAEKLVKQESESHCLSILRAAPALGRLDDGELFDGTGFAELARRISMDRGAFRVAAQGVPVHLESLERIAWALVRLTENVEGGTFHLLDEDDFSDIELIEWFARRFKVNSPIVPQERRVKIASQWSGLPGSELTFGGLRRHLHQAGAKIFKEKLAYRSKDYLERWFPEPEK